MSEALLPTGFEALAPLLAEWNLPTSEARMRKRNKSDMASIKQFYDAMAPRFEEALSHLDRVPYNSGMPDADRNLFGLCLSLAEITTAVEWYDQPQVVDGYNPAAIKMAVELP